jgi:succinoglycan biosynthesis transport protein ExoP
LDEGKTEAATRESSTIHAYLAVLRRRKWVFLQAVVWVPLAALVWSLQQSPLYEASSAVFLSRQNLAATLSGTQDPNAYQQADRVAQTQADLARTPEVARRALEEAKIGDRSPEDLLAQSSVTPEANADLLVFRVHDGNPITAAKLATAYATQFTSYRRKLDTASFQRAAREVAARIKQLHAARDRRSPLFASLVAKEQQLRTLEVLQTSNAFVVRAAGSASQIRPRPARNTVLGLGLGLVLGLGLAFLWDALDTRVRSTDEISERLGLPLLARLPAWERTKPPTRLRARFDSWLESSVVVEAAALSKNAAPAPLLAMLSEPHSIQAEAFRMLRTNLEFVNLGRHARTVMVTSAVEGEGKSTTAANLAVALARAGRRVRLVDLDLRRPILESLFSLEGRPGITDVALGRVDLEDAITPVAIPSPDPAVGSPSVGNGHGRLAGMLEVVSSGPIPPDAGEFIQTPVLADLLERLANDVNFVLIDAAPLLHVGDAMALSAKVDALLVVTRLEIITRSMLNELARVLDTTPAAKLGWVLTGAELGDGYGYGYGYTGRYGYGGERAAQLSAEAERVG